MNEGNFFMQHVWIKALILCVVCVKDSVSSARSWSATFPKNTGPNEE